MTVSAAAEPVAASGAAEASDDFAAFYRANAERVYRALAVTLRRDDLAGDAMAEAMARAWSRWAEVRELENPAGWVFRVGFNWATSWWRKHRRERPPGRDLDVPGPPGAAEGTVLAEAALACLSRQQRAVVVCRVLLDLSTTQTAAALGVSEGTVKSRLARALADLRRALKAEE